MPGRYHVAEPHVPTIAVVGVVASEQVHIRIDRDVINIPLPARNDLEARAVSTDADHAAAAERERRAILADRLLEPIIANGYVNVAVDSQADPLVVWSAPRNFKSKPIPLTSVSARSATPSPLSS